MINLKSPITFAKGVGEKKAEIFRSEFDITSIEDLLYYFPYRYVDKSRFYLIRELGNLINTYVQIKGIIISKEIIDQGRKKRLCCQFKDATGILALVWFNNVNYFFKNIELNTPLVVFGKPTLFNRSINITHPEISKEEESDKLSIPFLPMYNSSDKAKRSGLDSRTISKLCYQELREHYQEITENLPDSLMAKKRFISKQEAIVSIHFPKTQQSIHQAIDRLKFEEVFFMQLFLLQLHKTAKKQKGVLLSKVGSLFNEFYYHHLPFSLTEAQKRVIKEIRQDFISGTQMNRLLQGDVGSGKTITALLLMLLAVDNGYQCCLMAPTEILAQQHFYSIKKMLGDMAVKVELLTGSTKTAQRKTLLPEIEKGTVDILIGTHALTEDSVLFNKLGFVVIDEQHRFGVEQRAKLWKKNLIPPHVLVMTATPIPRTLAMTVYGDLDLSIIDQLPQGRKPIATVHFYMTDSLKINRFLRNEIAKGRQVYVVYPLIEESEKLDYNALIAGFEEFKKSYPEPNYHISCVHGRLSAEEKDAEMQKFKNGETQLMLATTVIEVGIDVPNATVMVIVNAERFGLSQLHQLRGRVGRGSEQSYCVLLTDRKLSNEGRKRIEAMTSTNNGFEIADVDLKLRGPGDISGTKQSGMLNFKLLNIINDERIIADARAEAQLILSQDPLLEKSEHAMLSNYLELLKKEKKNYYQIG